MNFLFLKQTPPLPETFIVRRMYLAGEYFNVTQSEYYAHIYKYLYTANRTTLQRIAHLAASMGALSSPRDSAPSLLLLWCCFHR